MDASWLQIVQLQNNT